MSLLVGTVSVNAADGTYTATAGSLVKVLFEAAYRALNNGSLVAPPAPPTTPQAVWNATIGAFTAAAKDAQTRAASFAALCPYLASQLPKVGPSVPAGGGLTVGVWQAAATMTGSPTVTIDGVGHTITRGAGSWIADGFAVGQTIAIFGSAANDSFAGAITGVTATVLTFASGLSSETIAAGANASIQGGLTRLGSYTISEQFGAGQYAGLVV